MPLCGRCTSYITYPWSTQGCIIIGCSTLRSCSVCEKFSPLMRCLVLIYHSRKLYVLAVSLFGQEIPLFLFLTVFFKIYLKMSVGLYVVKLKTTACSYLQLLLQYSNYPLLPPKGELRVVPCIRAIC